MDRIRFWRGLRLSREGRQRRAAMQALGSYKGGKMLFLGLGTGLGSTIIVDGIMEPMELGHLFCSSNRTIGFSHRNPAAPVQILVREIGHAPSTTL